MALHLCRRHQCLQVFMSRCLTLAQQPSTSSVPEKLTNYRDPRITEIVDVRSPEEYQEDHIPGAINLPVLQSYERDAVGRRYSSDKFSGRKLGAAFISSNISKHIEQYFKTKDQEYSPLIYCWRGGQRSYSLGLVLAQIGFNSFFLGGGHKRYRKMVKAELSTLPAQFEFRVITGPTGSGKTHILATMRDQGHQVLDLEALAKHKGSILGLWHGETQPSQAYFTSLLVHQLQTFNTSHPVWVESESVKLGRVTIPDSVFKCIQHSPRYSINLPMEERVKFTVRTYRNWIDNKHQLKEVLQKLVQVRGHKVVNRWVGLVGKGRWKEFVEDILVNHYDPSYGTSQRKNNLSNVPVQELHLPNLDKTTLDNIIRQIVDE